MKHGYLIDMDGVLYRGSELIPGADSFVEQLRARHIPFRLLTNNSQRTRRDVVAKVARLGIDVEEEHIFTSAMATARFLAQQKPNGTAFVIGEGGLLNALHQNGYAVVDHEPDYVVVGEGRTFNLELVEAAVRMIGAGAKLIATNLDPNCPTQDGLRPGCGALVALLETATGIKAFSVGKPSPLMMRSARKELGLATDEKTMIAGELYDPLDPELVRARDRARNLCHDLNVTREADQDARRRILKRLFGTGGESVWMQPPFFCDYGSNISLGERVFFNFNCVVLDVCRVTVGVFTLFGPAVQVYTATHPLNAALRRQQEFAKPTGIGCDVW